MNKWEFSAISLAFVLLITVAVILASQARSSPDDYTQECRVLCQSSEFTYVEAAVSSSGRVDCVCAPTTVWFRVR
jgi:hypothetical protein